MDLEFKIPSTVPQDLLLIQDLIGTVPHVTFAKKHTPDSPESSDDSFASSNSDVESEDEVEADLAPGDDDSGMSAAASDSVSPSDSDASSSVSEEEGESIAHKRERPPDDIGDEESGVTAAATYIQTKNEIVDANIMVPTISEVDPYDTLEKVGEIMSIVGNIVIVRGLSVDHIKSLSERALDAESLLVFEDRKVFGYIYETFGPTRQPLYQVKFNDRYPLDADKIRVSREVFHVPQRSHFVFVNQLKKTRGSDASNIHDEEPAEDEVEFSDDEEEAAFKAQLKKRRGRSASSSRCSTPASSRVHSEHMVHGTYRGSNPYDACGPYDDNFHITGPSRPSPVPYDDPYADAPTPDICATPGEPNGEVEEMPICESGREGPKAPRGHTFYRGARGRGTRLTSTRRRGFHQNHVTAQRTFDSKPDPSFPAAVRMVGSTTAHEQSGDVAASHPMVRPSSSAWTTNNAQGYRQGFIQPHINPRFAAMLGFNLPSASGPVFPWASQSNEDHMFHSQQWVNMWTMPNDTSPNSEGDTYRPM